MQDKSMEQGDISLEMQDAIAAYFEKHNGGKVSVATEKVLSQSEQLEWLQTQSLLDIPHRLLVGRPGVDTAWQNFRLRAFEVKATVPGSLGAYVSEALVQAEQNTLLESGLSKPTLEALKVDATPIEKLKEYELNDYANLARQYNIKDSAFPRMLKWLKGLGKNLSTPGLSMNRGMVFARDEEARQPGLSEAELANGLDPKNILEED